MILILPGGVKYFEASYHILCRSSDSRTLFQDYSTAIPSHSRSKKSGTAERCVSMISRLFHRHIGSAERLFHSRWVLEVMVMIFGSDCGSDAVEFCIDFGWFFDWFGIMAGWAFCTIKLQGVCYFCIDLLDDFDFARKTLKNDAFTTNDLATLLQL